MKRKWIITLTALAILGAGLVWRASARKDALLEFKDAVMSYSMAADSARSRSASAKDIADYTHAKADLDKKRERARGLGASPKDLGKASGDGYAELERINESFKLRESIEEGQRLESAR